jgi:hypothetical protein
VGTELLQIPDSTVERARRHEQPPSPQVAEELTPDWLDGDVSGARISSSPPRGHGFDATGASMLGLQQRAGNKAVQRYVGGALLQREPEGTATTAPPATGTVAPPAPAAPKPKTAAIKLSALYENVPGEAKDKIKRTKAGDALWFDPMTMLSSHPTQLRNTRAVGVVAGGEKTVDVFQAPMTEGDKSTGRGSISAELKYAGSRNKSFNVTVSGVPKGKVGPATAAARKVIEKELETFGDVEDITKTAQDTLRENEEYKDAVVSVNVLDDHVMDAGQSTFFYKVRGDASILMRIVVVPVGEKQTRYSGSKTVGKSSEDESAKTDKSSKETESVKKDVKSSERTTGSSTESVDVEYNETVARTLDDYVTKATTIHDNVVKDLSKKVVTDGSYHDHETSQTSRDASQVDNWSKSVEKGQKDKENWAAKLRKGLDIAKKVTGISWLQKLKGVGPILRKINGWSVGLDIADDVLGMLEEKGKVDYEDTTIKKDTTIKDKTDTTKDDDVKTHSDEETTAKLTEDLKRDMEDKWKRHLEDVTNITKKYKSTTKKESTGTTDKTQTEDYSRTDAKDVAEATARHKAAENQSTTTTFDVSTTWKYTAPVINAYVQDGDAEVNNVPFGPDVDEKAPAPAKTP